MRKTYRRLSGIILVASALVVGFAVPTLLSAPPWWTSRAVLDTNSVVHADYAPCLLGQVKWAATNAYLELEEKLPGGAGSDILDLVRAFNSTNNYYPINIGQLKYVAEPFYDRLIEAGYATNYPWTTGTTTDDVDNASAVIGQVKHVFDFDLSDFDSDSDGFPDWWEVQYFDDLVQDGSDDADGDGVSNLSEYQNGTDPNNADSDGDGVMDGDDANPLSDTDSDTDSMPDDWETHWFGDQDETAGGDYDGDGQTNLQEYQTGTDPTKDNVDDTGNATSLIIYLPLQ